MVSKFQWKPFWLATQRDPRNDWAATQNRVNYDVFAQAPFLDHSLPTLERTPLTLAMHVKPINVAASTTTSMVSTQTKIPTACIPIYNNLISLAMDQLHDTRAPFWTGVGTGSRARQVQDDVKILMADREFAVVSGRSRRLFPRVRFHFWRQRRRFTCILFLSCELPRSRSRQNSRARQRTDPLRPVNLKLEVAWPWTWSACAADSCFGSTDEGL